MDPLTLLREFVVSGHADQVVLNGDRVDFGGRYSFARSIPTSYKSQQGKEDFYKLESLLYFVKNFLTTAAAPKYTDYFKSAKQLNLEPVSFLDRKDIEEYLSGKKDSSDYIQLVIPDLQVDALRSPKRARLDAAGAADLAGAPGAGEGLAGADAAGEQSALQGILANEVQLRDRNSMLAVPNRNFSKVLALLGNVQKEAQKAAAARPQKPVIPVKGSGRYERQTQQDARLRQLGADVLGTVKTGFVTASDKPAAAAAAAAAGPSGPPPPPPIHPPTAPGRAPPPPAAPAAPPAQQQRHRHHHAQQPQHRSGSRSQPSSGGQRPRSGTPIIMVPPALTSMVNMYNIQALLEQGVFRTVEECKAELQQSGGKKQDLIKITRTMGRANPVSYHVTDKEPERKEDWRRVVAVFCLGKAWQFKKWPFKGAAEGDMVDTFSHVRGVFLHYNDEKVEATVKGWNVRVVGLNREGRHRDVTVVQEFWSDLDAFLQARKSSLLY